LPYRKEAETEDKKFIKALPTDNPDPAVKIWIDQQMKTASQITIERLIHGNFDYDETKDKLIEQEAVNDYFLNEHVKPTGRKFISADIARMGKDNTIIRVWDGLRVIERLEIPKSKVTESAAAIRALANKHAVPMSRVIVDEDGVGGGVKDILNCAGFVANAKPIGVGNYANLKAQCTFVMSQLINDRKVYEASAGVALTEKIKQEMDWVREKNADEDGKRKVISKEEVKLALRRSPDEWDSIMMRGYFELGSKL
jgi:phage terminase large subunit